MVKLNRYLSICIHVADTTRSKRLYFLAIYLQVANKLSRISEWLNEFILVFMYLLCFFVIHVQVLRWCKRAFLIPPPKKMTKKSNKRYYIFFQIYLNIYLYYLFVWGLLSYSRIFNTYELYLYEKRQFKEKKTKRKIELLRFININIDILKI